MIPRNNSSRAVLWAASTLTLIAASVNVRAQSANTDVPVKEVILFSSGVGYFQHEGTVHGDASTELRFKTTQINDILKSLVLNDLDGGHVGVVTYPSQAPLEKTLASFQVDISDNPSEGQLLDKLRGAAISLGYGGANGMENLHGTVLGVEEREVPGNNAGAEPLKKEFLNLVTGAGIRSLELARVDHFQLDDRNLQEELNRALAAVAGARDQEKKPVDVRFNGQGDRHVRLGYVVETPIWKASYRLVLPEKNAKDKKGLLQGWAIVENQTDNDWKDVRLSLVSGRPISFIQDLYRPLYVPRPTVVPELYASLRPQEYAGGQDKELNAQSGRRVVSGSNITYAGRQGSVASALDNGPVSATATSTLGSVGSSLDQGPVSATGGQAAIPGAPSAPAPMNASESVLPLSNTAKIGELFQYTVGNVSLARQQSAMIPIINDPVEAEKVSIYNEEVLAAHPLNGVRLKNTTEDKKHLSQGPVTVFEGGRYAGDARVDDVPPGQTRLLSYGVDLQMNVLAVTEASGESIQTARIVKGVLQVTRENVNVREYDSENKSEDDRLLVIEYPVRPEWKLADTPAPVETTDAVYRFEQPVAAGKTEKFTVQEKRVWDQEVNLSESSSQQFEFYRRVGTIPANVREALTTVYTRVQAMDAIREEYTQKDKQIRELSDDQGRIRDNIKAVDRTSAYATRLLKKLDDQESQLEKLRSEAEALSTRLEAQRKEYENLLKNLNLD